MRMVRSKVAGVSFRNRDGSNRQRIIRKFCRAGKSLDVRLEPDNAYSEDAMGLWVRGRWLFIVPARYQVGYIKNQITSEIREDVVRGCRISVRILEVTGGGWFRRHYYGVNIEIRLGQTTTSSRNGDRLKRSCEEPSSSLVPSRRRLDLGRPSGRFSKTFPPESCPFLRASWAFSSEGPARWRLGFGAAWLSENCRYRTRGVRCGAGTWTLGFFLDEAVGSFAVLRSIGVVTIIVGLGISSLGAVYSVSGSSGDGTH